MPFNPQHHHAGKWLKFELGQSPDLVVVHEGKVLRGKLVEGQDLDSLLSKVQRSADGRLVGVFVKGGLLRSPGRRELIKNEDGTPKHNPPQFEETAETFYPIPDCVAPIRAVLGADGNHSLEFAFAGHVRTVLLAIDSLKNADLILIREDIPQYRNDTLHENFDPAETAKPRHL